MKGPVRRNLLQYSMAQMNAPGNLTTQPKWMTLEFRKKAIDGKFHGRRPVRRTRFRWEDNIGKVLLIVAECKKMEETSRGQGTAEKSRTDCGLWRY
jgi:hypothetical protein